MILLVLKIKVKKRLIRQNVNIVAKSSVIRLPQYYLEAYEKLFFNKVNGITKAHRQKWKEIQFKICQQSPKQLFDL